MVATPECDRLNKISSDVSMLFEFFEWAQSQGLSLCTLEDSGKVSCGHPVFHYFPVCNSIQDIIYRFFEIDGNKLERERRALLAELQAYQS